jgi:hypothetical protein
MSRLLDSLPSMWALTQAKNLKKKAAADMEIAKHKMDLIASGLMRFVWQHSLISPLP